MSAHKSKISVSILTYNSSDTIRQCIDAVLSTEYGKLGEVWVVDNCSKDDCINIIKNEYPNVKLIANPVNEFFSVHNKVINQANSEYILILNPDLMLNNNALNAMVDYLDKNKTVVGTGPVHEVPGKGIERTARYMAKPINCFWTGTAMQILSPYMRQLTYDKVTAPSREPFDNNLPVAVEVLQDSCLMVRTEVLRSIGGYDPLFKLYYTEDDLCSRLRKKGSLVYLRSVKVEHLLSTSVRKEKPLKIRKIMFMDMLTYIHKHFGVIAYIFFIPLTYLSLIAWIFAKWIGIGKGKFSIRG